MHTRDAYPLWARWNDELDVRYTLGVEEELMLLQPGDWSLAQSGDEVLAGLSDELSRQASPETHAAVVELATGIHPGVDGVVGELASLRSRLARELGAMGLTAAAAGAHSLSVWEETEVSGAQRYRLLGESMRVLARREPTMALNALDRVHWLAAAVGADRQRAVAAWSGSLEHLVARLAGRFLAPDWLAATAAPST